MRVFLDGEQIDVSPPTVAGAIDAARSRSEAAGRIIIEALADGAPLDDDVLGNPPHDAAGYQELRFTSTPPGPFIRVTVLDAAESLDQVKRDQAEAARAIQTGRRADAVEPLRRVLEGWALVRDVLDKSQQLCGLGAAEIDLPNGEKGQRLVDDLAEKLGEIRAAFQRDDWADAGDVLAYEMPEQADRWRSLLEAYAERVARIA